MNVSRLKSILRWILDRFEEESILDDLSKLERVALKDTGQSKEEYARRLRNVFATLKRALEDSPINKALPSERKVLDRIGASDKLGLELLKRLDRCLNQSLASPKDPVGELRALIREIQGFREGVESAEQGLGAIQIDRSILGAEEYELGISIPRGMVNSRLDSFEAELHEIDRTLKVFGELAGDGPDSLKIKSLSASDLTIFLEILPQTAALLAVAIERLIALYKKILEIRKLRADLQEKNIPQEILSQIQKHEETVVQSMIRGVAGDLVEQQDGIENGRKNELTNALTLSLRFLADRIERGMDIELVAGEPVVDEPKGLGAESPTEHVKSLREARSLASRVNESGAAMVDFQRVDRAVFLPVNGPGELERE